MVAFRVNGFGGTVPRASKRLIADNQAQVAVNCRLTSGELQSLNGNKSVNAPGILGTIKSIFRINDKFVAWNKDVNASRGPIAGDTSYRTYFTGAGEPRVTNYALATSAVPYPTTFYVLGVFAPTTAPGVTQAGGVGVAVSRAFQYTYVTAWGEESKPSPASAVVTGKIDGTWTISSMDVAALNVYNVTAVAWAAGYLTFTCTSTFGLRAKEYVTNVGFAPASLNGELQVYDVPSATTYRVAVAVDPVVIDGIGTSTRVAPHNTASMTKRIYWTDNGSYWLVKENIAVITTSDTVAGTMPNGALLLSAGWDMPPADMIGLISLPNGMMAGFTGNEICFSEPFYPHAWPVSYRQTTDYSIVAIGAFGTNIVIGTTGTPYTMSGSSPSAMSMNREDNVWPCLSKRGMVSGDGGVLYPTVSGLAFIGLGGANLITKLLYTQVEWLPLKPDTFIAALHDSRYYSFYQQSTVSGMLILDGGNGILSSANDIITAAWNDPETGKLYIVVGIEILEWEGDSGIRRLYDWFSKEFLTLPPINLGAVKLDAEFTQSAAETAAAQAAYDAVVLSNNVRIGRSSLVLNGTLTIGSAIVTGLSSTAGLYMSLKVTGTGIGANSRVKSVDSSTQVTLTVVATASGTNALAFTGEPALLYGALGSSALGTYPLGGDALLKLPPLTFDSLQYTLYVNGVQKFTKTVVNSKAFALPRGYKADTISHRIAGNVKVYAIVAAESMLGLKGA